MDARKTLTESDCLTCSRNQGGQRIPTVRYRTLANPWFHGKKPWQTKRAVQKNEKDTLSVSRIHPVPRQVFDVLFGRAGEGDRTLDNHVGNVMLYH